jgi:hypothetical protein
MRWCEQGFVLPRLHTDAVHHRCCLLAVFRVMCTCVLNSRVEQARVVMSTAPRAPSRSFQLVISAALMASMAAASCQLKDAAGVVHPFVIAPASLNIAQNCPYAPALNGPKVWQVDVCNTQTVPTACNGSPSSFIYEMETSAYGGSCDVAFNTREPRGFWYGDGALRVTFTGTANTADDRVINVVLRCDPAASALTARSGDQVIATADVTQTVWTYNMTLYTDAACQFVPTEPPQGPEKPDDKSSGVAIAFVVIVFVVPAFYFAAFVGYALFVGKRGREVLPHPEFWRDAPYLIVDGFKFVKAKSLQLAKKGDGSGTYGPYNTEAATYATLA